MRYFWASLIEDSEYSVTETKILFEQKENGPTSANRLIDSLHLDKNYISSSIRNFKKAVLITGTPYSDDKHALIIQE